MGDKRDNIEVRPNKDGSLDEIVILDPHTGKCLFHLEQMDKHYYWWRAYGITQDLVGHIGATMGVRSGEPIYSASGHITGYEKTEGPVVNSDFDWEDSTDESRIVKPDGERRQKIVEIIDRFGISCLLQEVADILREGRKADHEQALITEIDNARTKFVAGSKASLDARIAEKFGKED